MQVEGFHLSGHTTGFHPQTRKLGPPYKTLLFTLAVKGLISMIVSSTAAIVATSVSLEIPRGLITLRT